MENLWVDNILEPIKRKVTPEYTIFEWTELINQATEAK